MPKLELKMRVISPMFVAGTDKEVPELRSATVRGHLRYWLRALIGARTTQLADVWNQEKAVFGATDTGSMVTVRMPMEFKGAFIKSRPLLPHREGTGNVSNARAIDHEATIDNQSIKLIVPLHVITKPGVAIPTDALNALKVWSLLGGMGRRSRRMMGAVRISSNDPQWYVAPKTADEFCQLLSSVLTAAVPHRAMYRDVPNFPTLAHDQSWVLVSTEGFDNPKEANQDFFRRLLRTATWRDSKLFGTASPRRASPLIAQVRLIGNQYYPVITVMKSEGGGRIDWNRMKTFMLEAKEHYQGVTVWGGW